MKIKQKKVLYSLFACFLCAAVLSAGITVGRTKEAANTAETNVEYVEDDIAEMMPHDGDVLVDSLKLRKAETERPDAECPNTEKNSETSMVTSDDAAALRNSDTYLDEVRATVEMDRNQIISMLSDAAESAESRTEKENATAQKLKIIDYMEKERMIEQLIRTKGLPECLVLISDNAVNVTVDKQDLQPSDTAKIYDIVSRESGRDAGQIVIQSKF